MARISSEIAGRPGAVSGASSTSPPLEQSLCMARARDPALDSADDPGR